MSTNKKYLWIIIFGALLLRLATMMLYFENNDFTFVDAEMYLSAASAVSHGDVLLLEPGIHLDQTYYYGEPLWPWTLSVFTNLFPDNFLPVRLFFTLLMVLAGWFVFQISGKLMGETWSMIGTALYLLYPFYIFFAGTLIQEPLLIVLMVTMTWSIFQYNQLKQVRYYMLLTIVILLLYYLRVTCIGLTPFLLLPLLVNGFNKKSFAILSVGIAILVILLLPWGWRNHLATGSFSLLTRTGEVGLPGNVAAGRIDIGSNLLEGMLASVTSIPGNAFDYFTPWINNVLMEDLVSRWHNVVSTITVAPLLISTVYILRYLKDRRILILLSIFILYSAPYILLFGQTRYRIPADFIMIIFLVVAIRDFMSKFSKTSETADCKD